MKILFTCNSLGRPGGVVTFTLQLARALTSLGHEVRWSGALCEKAGVFQSPVLPVVTGPRDFQPDILHLQHTIPAYAALLAFPGVPAVFHCHGGLWKDQPFLHPRVRHYLAMSASQAERLAVEFCLERSRISVHLNPVDTSRFQPGPALEERQYAILVYHGRVAMDDPAVSAIQEAAHRRGIKADCRGKGFGMSVVAPEKLLPSYPVVFASGISAMEAMACGCAVVVFGPGGCGEMVGSANFDRLRAHNFSIPLNCPPASPDAVARALDSYDPLDAASVTERIRREADVVSASRGLVGIYEKVIDSIPPAAAAPESEGPALASFLRRLAPLVATWDRSIMATGEAKP